MSYESRKQALEMAVAVGRNFGATANEAVAAAEEMHAFLIKDGEPVKKDEPAEGRPE